MTYSLQGLSATQLTAVAAATGIAEPLLKEGRAQAWNKENGIALTTTATTTTSAAPSPKIVTSKGEINVKMSKADATALTQKPEAKAAFASAIAKTIDVPISDVTILAIYVDGQKVSTRRLATESTVRVDWSVKATAPVQATAMNATALKSNIEAEAQAIANVSIAVTAEPSVTITDISSGTTTTTPLLGVVPSSANSKWCLLSFSLLAMLVVQLP